MFGSDFVYDLQKLHEDRKNFVEKTLEEVTRAVAVVGYDNGVAFVVHNPYAQEGLFFSDPLSKNVGVVASGSQGDYERMRTALLGQWASMLTLNFGNEGGQRECSARKIAGNHLARGLREYFQGVGSVPFKAHFMLADLYGDDMPELHRVSYDGTHVVDKGFSSLGFTKNVDMQKTNPIREFLGASLDENPDAWEPGLPIEEAIRRALKAMEYNFTGSYDCVGLPDKVEHTYERMVVPGLVSGDHLEITVLDRKAGVYGSDNWASVLPKRSASAYGKSPISESVVRDLASEVFEGSTRNSR